MTLRVSLYVNAQERAALEKRAREEGAALNYIVRIALRKELGLPIPGPTDHTQPHTTTHNHTVAPGAPIR